MKTLQYPNFNVLKEVERAIAPLRADVTRFERLFERLANASFSFYPEKLEEDRLAAAKGTLGLMLLKNANARDLDADFSQVTKISRPQDMADQPAELIQSMICMTKWTHIVGAKVLDHYK